MAEEGGKGLAGLGIGATIRLDNGEVCSLSLARISVRVIQERFIFFGRTLYNEKDLTRDARTGVTLRILFPNVIFPRPTRNPVLLSFANAIWYCSSAAQVAATLIEANGRVSDDQIEAVADEWLANGPNRS